MLFEIGFVYRRKDKFFLAVTENVLLTVQAGEFREYRPSARFEVVRNISVERLCRSWGVTSDELDRATAKYLTPSIEGRILSEPTEDVWSGFERVRTFKKAG
jgi:hypothetical protein